MEKDKFSAFLDGRRAWQCRCERVTIERTMGKNDVVWKREKGISNMEFLGGSRNLEEDPATFFGGRLP